MNEKTYISKVDGNTQKPRGRHLSRPPWPFWGPIADILDFAGGAALQAVSFVSKKMKMPAKLVEV